MIENELKRIADALEAIAIAIQPSAVPMPPETTSPAAEAETAPAKKAKTKPSPAPVAQEEAPTTAAPAGDKVWTTDEIVEKVQKAVKINRTATLEVCKKFGYEKSLKEIDAAKYPELAEALATIK